MALSSISGAMEGRPLPEYSAAKSPDSALSATLAISGIGRSG